MKTAILETKTSVNTRARNSMNHAALLPGSFAIVVLLLCFASLPVARAVVPAPDGGYPNFTTAEGQNALLNLTVGTANTAVGWFSLQSVTTGNSNTAVGAGALVLNTANENTATGAGALLSNTTGVSNTGNGAFAMFSNIEGNSNTATGARALFGNTAGNANTANGAFALSNNTEGSNNDAFGWSALHENTDGSSNSAFGHNALYNNITGDFNNAFGLAALFSNFEGNANSAFGRQALSDLGGGNGNTAIGNSAGSALTSGSDNVYIGRGVLGQNSESDHTYIRNINTTSVSGGGTDTVTVNLSTGLLGHLSSSRRYKEAIKPMDTASETLYRLKPVTYRYKKEIDPSQSIDYGLVAEDVAQVDPNLANRNRDGQLESVRYNAINAMLLNEFLREHKKGEQQDCKIEKLEATVTRLGSLVKEQAAQMQRMNARIEVNENASHTVAVED